MSTALQVTDLTVRNACQKQHVILDTIDISLTKSECLCVIGDSGSGKTTLLRAIIRLLPTGLIQTKGSLSINGSKVTLATIRSLWGNIISVVFQDPYASLNPSLTIARQFAILLREYSSDVVLTNDEVKKETLRLLNEVKIADAFYVLNKRPIELSGGMCQRINIALSLIKNPEILLMDEPTASLDHAQKGVILRLLQDIRKQRGLSILFVTHDMAIVQQIADKVVVLRKGKVIERVTRKSDVFHFVHDDSKRLLIDSEYMRVNKFGASVELGAEILRLSNVSKSYGALKVLENINLTVHKHDSLGIIGASGKGKTTLARIMAGYEQASTGTLHLSEGSRVELVFQDTESSVSPYHTVNAVLNEYRMIKRQPLLSEKVLLSYMKILGLPRSALSKKVVNLSGGQLQRIVILRALLSQPNIVIFDEPTSALDTSSQKKTLEFIRTLSEQFEFTYIIISHNIEVIEMMCKRYVVVESGTMLQSRSTVQAQ